MRFSLEFVGVLQDGPMSNSATSFRALFDGFPIESSQYPLGVEPTPIIPPAYPLDIVWSRSPNAARGATPGLPDGGGQGRAPVAPEWLTMAQRRADSPPGPPGDTPPCPYATGFKASLILRDALLAASCRVLLDKWL